MHRYLRTNSGVAIREAILLLTFLIILGIMIIPRLVAQEGRISEIAAMNNLRQWNIGLNLYLLEHNNRLPDVGPSTPDANLTNAWYNALPPYLSQLPWSKLTSASLADDNARAIIWSDPAFRKLRRYTNSIFLFPYAMNRFLQPDPSYPAYRIFDVANPQTVIFLGESASMSPGLMPETISFRHARNAKSERAKAHVLFVDGHAAAMERRELESGSGSVAWLPFGQPSGAVE